MAELKDNNPITADGDYTFQVTPGQEYSVSFTQTAGGGTFGSGTFSIQYDGSIESTGNYETYPDGTFTSNGSIVILAHSRTNNINVSGSTSPSVEVKITQFLRR